MFQFFSDRLARSNREFNGSTDGEATTSSDPPLRKCQQDCLEACAKGARKIEMACGTGKTRVMKELAANVSGRVSCPVMKNLPECQHSQNGVCMEKLSPFCSMDQ